MKPKGKKQSGPKRCGVKKDNGKRCKAFCVSGKDTCFFHSDEAPKARAKGRAVMSAEMQRIEDGLKKLDLRSPEVQKKHLANWIRELIDRDESVANIARLYALLIQLTKEADPTQTIVVKRIITVPGSE